MRRQRISLDVHDIAEAEANTPGFERVHNMPELMAAAKRAEAAIKDDGLPFEIAIERLHAEVCNAK